LEIVQEPGTKQSLLFTADAFFSLGDYAQGLEGGRSRLVFHEAEHALVGLVLYRTRVLAISAAVHLGVSS
jgi:hypothetical protein